jgi:hypothetical protein
MRSLTNQEVNSTFKIHHSTLERSDIPKSSFRAFSPLSRLKNEIANRRLFGQPTSPTGLLILAQGNPDGSGAALGIGSQNNRRLKVCIIHGKLARLAYDAGLQPAVWRHGRPRAATAGAVLPQASMSEPVGLRGR